MTLIAKVPWPPNVRFGSKADMDIRRFLTSNLGITRPACHLTLAHHERRSPNSTRRLVHALLGPSIDDDLKKFACDLKIGAGRSPFDNGLNCHDVTARR
jgi:hypothetical protein